MIVPWMNQKNMKDSDIRTMSKYLRKRDEVIDATDLIVVVWRQRGDDWYLPTCGFRISRIIIYYVPASS
jgi:hypothetical protein